MRTNIRLVNPLNGHEEHAHSAEGPYWVEIYRDDKLVARILSIDQGGSK